MIDDHGVSINPEPACESHPAGIGCRHLGVCHGCEIGPQMGFVIDYFAVIQIGPRFGICRPIGGCRQSLENTLPVHDTIRPAGNMKDGIGVFLTNIPVDFEKLFDRRK